MPWGCSPGASQKKAGRAPGSRPAGCRASALQGFIGTVVGYAVAIGIGMVIDFIWFPGEGHGFHNF